jgi:hypothetical protein
MQITLSLSLSLSLMYLTASVLIGSVVAVLITVAEETPLDAVSVSAGEEVLLTDGLVGKEQRLHLLLLRLCITIADGGLPVARLLLDVEGEAGRASDGLQALNRTEK